MAASGFYADSVVGALRPPAQILQWDISKQDPSGFKHVESGVYTPLAKLGNVGGFQAQSESGVALDFGSVYISSEQVVSFYSKTACFTFNLGEVNTHPDSYFDQGSGINSTGYKVFNTRFWLHNHDAISGFLPTYYYLTSKHWRTGFVLTSGTSGVLTIPQSMPASQNILFQGRIFASGAYSDTEFSDFIYARILFPSGIYTHGVYGGLGSGNFTFKISYDWTALAANVGSGDLV
jgi:hypothetical protein